MLGVCLGLGVTVGTGEPALGGAGAVAFEGFFPAVLTPAFGAVGAALSLGRGCEESVVAGFDVLVARAGCSASRGAVGPGPADGGDKLEALDNVFLPRPGTSKSAPTPAPIAMSAAKSETTTLLRREGTPGILVSLRGAWVIAAGAGVIVAAPCTPMPA